MHIADLPPMLSPYPGTSDGSPTMDRPAGAVTRFLRSRRGLILIVAVAAAIGAGLHWSWLVAAGIAPVLLAVLPCVAMCALGLCMNHSGRKTGTRFCGDNQRASVKETSTPGPPG